MQARLSNLRQAGLVDLMPASGYRLTAIGRELHETFLPLHRFAERWSKLNADRSSNRRHRQAGAIGLHDSDAAAGGGVGAGDAPDRIVDSYRARPVDDRLFQREHPADQRVGALVEKRIALARGGIVTRN